MNIQLSDGAMLPCMGAGNLDVFNFSLAPEDMEAVSALNRNQRSSPDNDPENFPW